MDEITNLKRATVSVPPDLDYKFKKLASQKFKFEKGWYSKAMVEAMDMWIRYNDFVILKEGTGYVGRFLGMQMWDRIKRNLNSTSNFETQHEPLNQVLNCFSSRSSHIENINYQINNTGLKICLKSPDINNKSDFMVEDLLINYLQPITLITRAGMEDITGNEYKVHEFKVGNSNKIHLKKLD